MLYASINWASIGAYIWQFRMSRMTNDLGGGKVEWRELSTVIYVFYRSNLLLVGGLSRLPIMQTSPDATGEGLAKNLLERNGTAQPSCPPVLDRVGQPCRCPDGLPSTAPAAASRTSSRAMGRRPGADAAGQLLWPGPGLHHRPTFGVKNEGAGGGGLGPTSAVACRTPRCSPIPLSS